MDVTRARRGLTRGWRVQVTDAAGVPRLTESVWPWRMTGLWRATVEGALHVGISEAFELRSDSGLTGPLVVFSSGVMVVDERPAAAGQEDSIRIDVRAMAAVYETAATSRTGPNSSPRAQTPHLPRSMTRPVASGDRATQCDRVRHVDGGCHRGERGPRGRLHHGIGQVALLGIGVYGITHLGEVLTVVGGVAATAVAVSAGAAAVQRRRGAWRPLGPGLVSTAARMVEGHSCARCRTARLISVPAVAVVMSAAGDVAGVCAAHLDAVRLGASTRTTDIERSR